MDTKTLYKGYRFLEEFRKLDPEMPTQQAAAFLMVAMTPGITMKDMARKLGISQASCSRNVSALSEMHRLNKPGLDLVYAIEDPAERRRKIVNLTPRGERVAESLREILF